MRKLFDINADIEAMLENGVDPETGEFTLDVEALEALQMEREQKLENIMLYIKKLDTFAGDCSREMERIGEEKKKAEKHRDRLLGWIAGQLNGENFQTARVKGTFRKSVSVECDENFCRWAYETGQYDFITHKETDTPDKRKIMTFLKNGGELEYACLVEKNSLTVK